MDFEFATATRIIFGTGKLQEAGAIAAAMGGRALVVTGGTTARAQALLDNLAANKIIVTPFAVAEEPTISVIQAGVEQARRAKSDLVISFGGGSAVDAGKAIAALVTNHGDPLDYLEVIGLGQPLTQPPLPFMAIPTTAGTGAEVTRNAVLGSPEHRVKVSLRSAAMLPQVALVDPALTYTMPPAITASTGMDALTQVLEPYVSHLANPLTDTFCQAGLRRAARSLRQAYQGGDQPAAREDMALVSLLGGLALANAKLGAVHGFAGPMGGMFPAPHGAICARLLPPVMAANVRALQDRDPENMALGRYAEIAQIFTGRAEATIAEGVRWIQELGAALQIPPLSTYGIRPEDFDAIIAKSAQSSSMKGNPIQLTADELRGILEEAV